MFLKYFWLTIASAFSLGIFGAHKLLNLIEIEKFYFFVLFLIFLIASFLFSKSKSDFYSQKLSLFFLFVAFLFFAVWRYLIAWPDLSEDHISYYADQKIDVLCSVEKIEFKNEKENISAQIFKILKNGEEQDLSGKVLISSKSPSPYSIGDILKASGLWEKGSKISNFDYGLYLRRNNISLYSRYPQIILVGKEDKNFIFKNLINRFKNFLSQTMDFHLSSDSASLAKAILLGDKSDLAKEQRDVFSKSGLSHLIAISGLHISLISTYCLSLLLSLGCSRKKAFYFLLIFLFLYLSLIAWPPSAFRAYLMGSLSLLALHLNRKGSVANLLFFAAFVLLLINPFLLLADLGFQLSFLAVLAIIYLHPRLKEFFLKIISKFKIRKFEKTINSVLDIFSITLSTQIMTAPILIRSFEQFSLVAPLSNLLVLWLVPFIIIFLILGLFLSALFPFLSSLVFIVVEIFFRYLNFVAEKSILIPKSFLALQINSPYFVYIYYLVLFYLLNRNRLKTKLG